MAVDEFAGNGAEMQAGAEEIVTVTIRYLVPKAEAQAMMRDDRARAMAWGDVFAERDAAEDRCSKAVSVARAYEAWEADLILNGDWSNELPRMTQAQYDRLLEIQAMRNAALRKAGGPDNG